VSRFPSFFVCERQTIFLHIIVFFFAIADFAVFLFLASTLLCAFSDGHEKNSAKGGDVMLSWSITFLVIGLIAGVLGLSGIAGAATQIAWILFVVFLVLFVVSLIMGRGRAPL
jgi:uncharacterized membrane protein YtjA (UPF0391 family)